LQRWSIMYVTRTELNPGARRAQLFEEMWRDPLLLLFEPSTTSERSNTPRGLTNLA
jgi:hypothetical protein